METEKPNANSIDKTITSGNNNLERVSASYLSENNNRSENHPTHVRGPKLLAERIFDGAVYGFWNYGLQAGTSVAAAIWFHEGGGKPYFDKAADWLGKNVMEHITSKTGKAAAAEAHTPLMFTSLITVGNLFIPPMQYAEHHKAHYVSKINDWLNARRTARGNAPTEEELAEQKAEIQAIANAPLQSSKELWTGRALGLAGNYVAAHLVGEQNNVMLKNAFAEGVSHGLNTVGLKGIGNSELMKSVSRMAFLDYGYSIISSNIVYAYGHYINPPQHKKDKATPATVVGGAVISSGQPKQTQYDSLGHIEDRWAETPVYHSHSERANSRQHDHSSHLGGLA